MVFDKSIVPSRRSSSSPPTFGVYCDRILPASSSSICSRNAVRREQQIAPHINEKFTNTTGQCLYCTRLESWFLFGIIHAFGGCLHHQYVLWIFLIGKKIPRRWQCEHVGVSREQRNFRFLQLAQAGTSSSPAWLLPLNVKLFQAVAIAQHHVFC